MFSKNKQYKVLVQDMGARYDFHIWATGRRDASVKAREKLERSRPGLTYTINSCTRTNISIFGENSESVVELSATVVLDEMEID